MDREGVECKDDVEVHRPNEVGDGEASDCPAAGVNGDDQVEEASSGSFGSIVTRCAPGRIVKINKKLSAEQRNAVKDLGFGSLLDMSQTKIRRKLCKKLVDSYVLKENVIKIDGKEIEVSPTCVSRVMGFGAGGMEVSLTGAGDSFVRYSDKFTTQGKGIPVNKVAEALEKCKFASEEFKVMYTLLVMHLVLAPTSSVYMPAAYLHVALDVGNVRQRNWGKWSFEGLVKGVAKFQKNPKVNVVGGNMLFLQTLYFEVMNEGKVNVPSNMPPVVAWDPVRMKKTSSKNKACAGGCAQEANTAKATVNREEHSSNLATQEDLRSLRDDVGRLMTVIGMPTAEEGIQMSMNAKMDIMMKQLQSIYAFVNEFGAGQRKGSPLRDTTEVADQFDYQKDSGKKDLHEQGTSARSDSQKGEVRADEYCPSDLKTEYPYAQQKDKDFLNEVMKDLGHEGEDTNLMQQEDVVDMGGVAKKIIDSGDGPKNADEPAIKEHQPCKRKAEEVVSISSCRTPVVTRRKASRKTIAYQKSQYEKVAVPGGRKLFRAGPFAVSRALDWTSLQYVQYIFQRNLEPSEPLAETKSLTVTRKELMSLSPREWVNDRVISMVADYKTIMEHRKQPSEDAYWYFTADYGGIVLSERKDKSVPRGWRKRYMRNFNKCVQVMIPVNDTRKHWFLLVVRVAEKTAEIWDPMPDNRSRTRRTNLARRVLASLDAALSAELAEHVKGEWEFGGFEIKFKTDIATQPNGWDCGLYIMLYMTKPYAMQITDAQIESECERAKLAVEVVSHPWNDIRDNVKTLAGDFCLDMMGTDVKLEEGDEGRNEGGLEKRVPNTNRKSFTDLLGTTTKMINRSEGDSVDDGSSV